MYVYVHYLPSIKNKCCKKNIISGFCDILTLSPSELLVVKWSSFSLKLLRILPLYRHKGLDSSHKKTDCFDPYG